MTTSQNPAQKKVITHDEFEKRVEIEAQNLMYFDRMHREKAVSHARDYVNTKFIKAA